MITEVFVSLNGVDFNKLDLENDESIPMRYTFKDTKDIATIFSPYSLNFTFNATPNNLLSLGYFGNTDVVKDSNLRKLKCKVYVNSILNQFGLLKLEKIAYKMGKPSVITASFATTMTSLKDKIGDDTIDILGSKLISWMPNDIKNSIQGITSLDIEGVPLKYFVPLASTNRVWQYNNNANGEALDNIYFDSSLLPTSENLIKGLELRPAITFSSIVELIKKKYGLLIVSPLENRSEYKDAYVWCMGKEVINEKENKFIFKNNFDQTFVDSSSLEFLVPKPIKYKLLVNLPDSSILVEKLNNSEAWKKFFNFQILFNGLNFLGNISDSKVTLKIYRKGETIPIVTELFNFDGNPDFKIGVQISDFFLIDNKIDFYATLSFSQPIIWTNTYYAIQQDYKASESIRANYHHESTVNNNFQSMGGAKIDLIKALPQIKVIDFLTSYFKAFNISALDVSPDDDSLYWFTPQDILANKKQAIYTADISDVDKTTQDDYNYYIFKHAESKFRSNSDYKIGAGADYAQTSYPAVKPKDAKEFKIETNFTLIPPVSISGTEITTIYGFDNGTPNILETGEARYAPNFGELPIFYSHGNTPLGLLFGIQSSLSDGTLVTQSISSYIKILPYTTDLKSFAWSILVINNLALRDNLFSRYYIEIIKRYIDQNVMKHDFTLTLSANEVRDFKLENDIIIGENKFTIIDSTIDIVTGKTKLTLLNY